MQQFTARGSFSDGSSKDLTSTAQWSSSDTTIASVSGSGLASGAAIGVVTIKAVSGSFQATAVLTITNAGTNLLSIAVSSSGTTIPVNTSQQFSATGNYSDGSSRDLTSLVSWNSSVASVATIDANGNATGVSSGTTTISATLGPITGSTGLTVSSPTISSIVVTPGDLTLGIGIPQQYTATAIFTNGSSQDLSSGVTWTSSQPSVASVDNSGLATTLSAGQTTITATVGSFSDSSVLTVVPAKLLSIAVKPSPATIAVGTQQQFTATGSFDDGSTQVLTSATWSSSATNIAVVDSSGNATGTGVGTATISVKSGSVTGTATLNVTGATLTAIAVTPANPSMAIGTTLQFTATGTFSDSSHQDITTSVLWSSAAPAVATINNQGIATSASTGTSTITATLGSVSGSTTLTVSNVSLVSITISPANPRIDQGTSIRFTATGKFSDGSTGSNLSGLSWKSSKPNIANVRQSGIAHGKKSGSVTISATASGVTGTTTLTIGTGTLQSIAISPVNPSVVVGSTQQFSVTGTFSDGTSQDVTLNSHWSSSVASVATIANGPGAGLATTFGTGNTVIGANSGGITNSTTLNVH
jgi:trimeric autotransporter adhesin